MNRFHFLHSSLLRSPRVCWIAAFFVLSSLPLSAHAELADRGKPISMEAERVTIDDIKRVQVLEGNVVLTQGTLMILADKIIVTEDAQGYQHGTAFSTPGKLARFRQKREGREEWIEGEAERIEYDTHHEIAELFHRAWIQSGGDQLRGDYIWYDGISERYLASNGAKPDADAATSGENTQPSQRVRVVIQPRNKSAPAASDIPAELVNDGEEKNSSKAGNDNLRLKTAPLLTPPEHP